MFGHVTQCTQVTNQINLRESYNRNNIININYKMTHVSVGQLVLR
jgi:hypothetical protein